VELSAKLLRAVLPDGIISRKSDIKAVLDEAAGKRYPNLINVLYFQHQDDGRTPLAYAVANNNEKAVRNLVELKVDLSVVMGVSTTALTLAVTNTKFDGTNMVRMLLSMGADPAEIDKAGIIVKDLNITMQYWLRKAKAVGRKSKEDLEFLEKAPPMHRMHELQYALVGQFVAIDMISSALTSRFSNAQAQSSPLVMLLAGPPGHGKTEISRNAAKSLVGEQNFLEIACGALRDDANLFGSNRGGVGGSEGQLALFLKPRENVNTIIFLDEFEKIKGLTSDIGWAQDQKMYTSFLEAWQEGTLTDQGCTGKGAKINASRVVWMLTSNWGQDEILHFAEEHKERVYSKMDEANMSWVETELIKNKLKPLVMQKFKEVSKELQALSRRINVIAPFLPFTTEEQLVVADCKVRHRFQQYRAPAVHPTENNVCGNVDKSRLYGNLDLQHTPSYCRFVAEQYQPMEGADSFTNPPAQVDGKFVTKLIQNKFELSQEVICRIRSDSTALKASPKFPFPEPQFWVHYDTETNQVKLTKDKPLNPGKPLELNSPIDRTLTSVASSAIGGSHAPAPVLAPVPNPWG